MLSKKVPWVALTATALPVVQKEIIQNLAMKNPILCLDVPNNNNNNIMYSIVGTKTRDKERHFKWLVDELLELRENTKKILIYVYRLKDGAEINR